MHESTPLITTIALALGFGLNLGFLAERLKLPALVGYLLAGVVIGPHTPGVFADVKLAHELAEIGVMLLMFGVGLHFSLDDLKQVRKVAVPGAILQMAVTALLGTTLAGLWGWNLGGSLIFGLSLSVASTVVLLRSLESRGMLDSMNGRVAVGWLIVQDLAMVFVLVLIPPLAGQFDGTGSSDASRLWIDLGITLAKVSVFIALMLVAGRRFVPRLLWRVARTGSRELFTLSVVAAAVSIAYAASALFDVSFALGAFFAGMVMRESDFSHRAAEESLPLREAFSVLFFVSVGMLFDPAILIEHPLQVLAVLLLIVVVTPLTAATVVLVFRYPLNTALLVLAGLAQIGEFSFILAGLGISLNLMPVEGQNLILAGAIISITFNQLIFSLVTPALNWIRSRSRLARKLERSVDPLAELPMSTDEKFLSGQVVLVGYGHVGQRIASSLTDKGIPFVIAEQNREVVENLRRRGFAAVSGNAADPAVLIQAHIARASLVVITTPDAFDVRQMIDTARLLNPAIEAIVRSDNEEEATLLAQDTSARIFLGEEELARNISAHVLKRYGKSI